MRVYLAREEDSALATRRAVLLEKLRRYNPETNFASHPDHADLVLLVEEYSYKTWRHVAALKRCTFVRRYAEKILTLNHDDAARPFLPGLYTSLPQHCFNPAVHMSCAYPETPHGLLESQAAVALPASASLATFRGMLRSSPVRGRLYERYQSDSAFRFTIVDRPLFSHATAEQEAYLQDLASSQYVLCPRGWAPVTYRLFEAMAMARCPVIISDDWVPIAGVDWSACSLRVRESDIGKLGGILRERRDQAASLGQNARQVWEQHFCEPERFRAFLRLATELQTRRPQSGFDELSRYWHSQEFRRLNGWTWQQRIAARWARLRNRP